MISGIELYDEIWEDLFGMNKGDSISIPKNKADNRAIQVCCSYAEGRIGNKFFPAQCPINKSNMRIWRV